MKKTWKYRSLSLVLALVLLFEIGPMQVFAAGAAEDDLPGYEDAWAPLEPGEPVQVRDEMDGLRDQGEKQFRLSDGSYIAVDYGFAVHYRNEDGRWEDIDNSLQPVSTMDAAGDPSLMYIASSGDRTTAFASTLGSGLLFQTEQDGSGVTMSLLDPSQAEELLSIPEETAALETEPAEVTETEPETETIPQEAEEETTLPAPTEETVSETVEETAPEAAEETVSPETEAALEETEAAGEASLPAEETVAAETEAPTEEIAAPTEAAENTPVTEPLAEETVPADGLVYDRTSALQMAEPERMTFALEEGQESLAQQLIPENLCSAVLYPEVFPGVDLSYNLWGNNIKESILVNEPLDSYRFSFLLDLDGLTPQLQADGSILLSDTSGQAAYEIPAPYMVDSAANMSTAAFYTLTELEEGFLLTVEADNAWMEAPEREYPIAIDPTLIETAPGDKYNTQSVFVMEGNPKYAVYNTNNLYLGYSSDPTRKEYQAFMHFNQLPTLPKGSVVVNASLNLHMNDFSQIGCPEIGIGLYGVTEDKQADRTYADWFHKMCWNNKPAFDTENMIDYVYTSLAKKGSYLSWDMTELVNNWYTTGTENHTVALAATPEKTYSDKCCAVPVFTSFNVSGTTYHPPILTVTYRNNTGLEPYYTYQALSAGNAGTAYISDYNNQVTVVKDLVGYQSAAQPFQLQWIFNSSYFSEDNTSQYDLCADLGMAMHVGSGAQLNVIQQVKKETINGETYLRYLDGDGTIHYFAKDPNRSSTYYYDEDGLGLKISEQGILYSMTDDRGNQLIFANGLLLQIVDPDGNRVEMHYSQNGAATDKDYPTGENDRLEKIMLKPKGAAAFTIATFKYKSHAPAGTSIPNYLDTVTDYAGNYYTFSYLNGKVSSLSYNGTEIAKYNMQQSGSWYINQLNSLVDVERNYSLHFYYMNNRIGAMQEKGSGASGAKLQIRRNSERQTVYRDFGADRTIETADDILTYYSFDYAGRTVNAYTTDSQGNILGASNAVYSGTGTTDKRNNRTLCTAAIGASGLQVMRNGGMEHNSYSGQAWSFGGTGTNATLAVSTGKPRTGSNSLKGDMTGTPVSMYAKKSSDPLQAGKDYTFSGYVNTSSLTGFHGKGIYLQVKDSAGNVWQSEPVAYKTSPEVEDGWVRLSLTFTAKTAGAHTVYVYNDKALGTFYADDLQFEQGPAPTNVNLLENGGLESSNTDWYIDHPGISYATTTGISGSSTRSIEIIGTPNNDVSRSTQEAIVNLPGTQTYVVSGWARANAVPDNVQTAEDPATDMTKQFGLRAIVCYGDGTYEYHYVPFNPDLTCWQYASLTVVPKCPEKLVASVKVQCAYERNANTAYFDNLSIVREVAQTMTYDEDGNLVSVNSTGLKEDTSTYSGGNLIKTVTGGSGTFTYTYGADSKKHQLQSVSNGKVTESLSYDGFGNVTGTSLQAADGTGKTMQTSASYEGSGTRLTQVTDSTGQSVSYGYGDKQSQMRGLPTTTTGPDGTVVTSIYDNRGRITQNAIENDVSLRYNYSNGSLNYVQRTAGGKNQRYSFTYDGYGNRTGIRVGESLLAGYEYAPGNGNLTRQTYGNGDSVSFTYDDLGRVTKATYSDGRVLTYAYSGDGQLYSLKDNMGTAATGDDLTYLYNYDSLGRLMGSEEKRGGATALRARQEYDEVSRLSGQSWQLGDTAYSESYTYNADDGSLDTMQTAAGQTLEMIYDGLQRLSSVKAGIYTRNYTYRDISATQTTPQVQKVSYSGLTDTTNYTYLYDTSGRITRMTEASGDYWAYAYDNQGQMKYATDYAASGTGRARYKYTYDKAGNILSWQIQNGAETVVLESHTYTYGDANWKDLLTAFDGETISYDASGNPISYYNGTRWSFDWNEGRRLTSATEGGADGTSIAYTYDGSGTRTTKTVDGVTHTYTYASGKLLRETYGNTTLDFCYDNTGRPFALTLTPNGTTATYYYITNLQGDVMSLVDASGNEVAEYTYDPWGKVLTETGNLAGINPLKYRGYYHDSETGFYYLMSRYYDPAICRFINADSYASTGQGFLGCNMFAYCNNGPINHSDPTGHEALGNLCCREAQLIGGGCGGGIVATVIVVGGLIGIHYAAKALSKLVYDCAKAIKAELEEAKKHWPVVHHIVPKGDFSSRSDKIQDEIREMHAILDAADINVFVSPFNLMLVSREYHASLHTDEYIHMVYSYIEPAKGDTAAVYMALFLVRIVVAANDPYAIGY